MLNNHYFNKELTLFYTVIVPNSPSEFTVSQEAFTPINIFVTLLWDPPQGMGPQFVVDYYRIIVSPPPLSDRINLVNTSYLIVTLDYNLEYTAILTAINCAGESSPLFLTGIDYGE